MPWANQTSVCVCAERGLGPQQVIHESRLPIGDFGRVFPHDRKHQPNIVSQGLLHRESFIEGLSPQAFFIHAIAFGVSNPFGVEHRPPGSGMSG